MQASFAWTAPSGTLGRIVDEARIRARALEARRDELTRLAGRLRDVPSFAEALRGASVAVIAEIKRRSPSKGWIQPDIDAAEQGRAYASAGAAAISVLTEPEHFAGSSEDLTAVRAAVGIPLLKKDFHVSPVQLLEAKALGASAALLIARALGPSGLSDMLEAADDLDLGVLVEIRDERELEQAMELDVAVIGINNRNLETLAIDTTTSEQLLQLIPEYVIAVAESGISGRTDVERVARAGANAVLVGSSISAAANPAEAVRQLTGVTRTRRGN